MDICKYCKFFNKDRQMISGSHICNFHGYTTKPENRGCYKIQFNKINETSN